MKYKLPRALMRTKREEFSDLPMQVLEGQIPKNISGYAYFMIPAGDCEDGEYSMPNEPILGGDGMILKLDLNQENEAKLSVKFAVSESFLADEATFSEFKKDDKGNRVKNPFFKYRFSDFGLGRLSFKIGMRNRLNTAITPIKFPEDGAERIVVCSDDGRPYLCDPKTLKTYSPIGALDEWEALMGSEKKFLGFSYGVKPFPLIMATAHPVFDPKTNEFFGVNYGRVFADTIRNLGVINSKIESIRDLLGVLLVELPKAILLILFGVFFLIQDLFNGLFAGRNTKRFTHVFSWEGKGKLKKVNLVLPNGKNVVIKQTLHQIALTENHIVLLDASFKFTPDQIINSLRPYRKTDNLLSEYFERVLRWLMTSPMEPNAMFYFVKRKEFEEAIKTNAYGGELPNIQVTSTELPFETLHFLTDYKEENGKITMHLAHNNAACLAEWLRPYDYQYTGKKYTFWERLFGFGKTKIQKDLLGMLAVGQMDVSRIEKVEVDPDTGSPIRSFNILSFGNTDNGNSEKETIPNTFNLSFYAYLDQTPVDQLPEKIEYIFWMCSGLFPEALTEFIHRMYAKYEHRVISLKLFDQITQTGKPSNLIRVNCQTMEIEDSFIFSPDQVGMSPQFIPKSGQPKDPKNGYIVCTVYTYREESNSQDIDCEFWIFDGGNLAQGPLCRLGHPDAIFGMTLHTAYTASAEPVSSNGYKVNVQEELTKRIRRKKDKTLHALFEEHVFPYFKN
jgi:carotenoid cleavage dioxygenase-like enzyme